MSLPKTLVIGAGGFLGKAFVAEYEKCFSGILGTIRRKEDETEALTYLDLENPYLSVLNLSENRYENVLILAACSKLAFCEANTELSHKINVTGINEIIRQVKDAGLFPIFFSSDVVFSGEEGDYTESDTTNPVNYYGRQKEEVERYLIENYDPSEYLIIRLSKVYSLNKEENTLLDEMAQKLIFKKELHEAYDQVFCPIFKDDVVKVTLDLQSKRITGVVHLCGDESKSRYELSCLVADGLGINKNLIKKSEIRLIDPNCPRPKNTSMQNSKLQQIGPYNLMNIKDAVSTVCKNWKVSNKEVNK
jgi:dTDP-4-dehydrorhamnose reductase